VEPCGGWPLRKLRNAVCGRVRARSRALGPAARGDPRRGACIVAIKNLILNGVGLRLDGDQPREAINLGSH